MIKLPVCFHYERFNEGGSRDEMLVLSIPWLQGLIPHSGCKVTRRVGWVADPKSSPYATAWRSPEHTRRVAEITENHWGWKRPLRSPHPAPMGYWLFVFYSDKAQSPANPAAC